MKVCCPEDTFEEPEELVVKDGLGSIEDDQGTVWDFPTEPPKTSVRHSSNDYYDEYYEDEALYEEAYDKEAEEINDFDNEDYYGHKCPTDTVCSQIEKCSEEGKISEAPSEACLNKSPCNMIQE